MNDNHHKEFDFHHKFSDDFSNEQNKKLCFNPPLYIQRYNYVSSLLYDFKCKSFMDIGCAECKLIHLLKQANQNLNLIVGLDLDEDALERNKLKFSDNLVDMFHCRENPLDLYLIKGDISNPDKSFLEKFSYKNCGLDFVSMVEIIEHMHPETLQNSIQTVFHQLRPKYVLISTPNSEFNQVFEKNDYDERKIDQKFRHWDHKFEWTRNEFQKWCKEKILDTYQSYKLFNNSFYGLGEPPEVHQNVGFCTQMALFYNQEITNLSNSLPKNLFQNYLDEKKSIYLKNRYRKPGEDSIQQKLYFNNEDIDNFDKNDLNNFKIIYSFSYPFEMHEFNNKDERNRVILDEISYLISFLTTNSKYQSHNIHHVQDSKNLTSHLTEEEKEKIDNDIDIHDDCIQLAKVEKLLNFSSLKKFNVPFDELIDLMKKAGYNFTKNDKFVIHKIQIESEFENGSEGDYDELNSIESRRDETDFSICKIDEQFIDNSQEEDKKMTSLKDVLNFGEEDWDQYLPKVDEIPDLKYKESLCEQFQDADGTDFEISEEYIQNCLNFDLKTRRNRLRLTDFKSCNYNAEKQKKYTYNLRAIRKRNRRVDHIPPMEQFCLD